MNEEQKKRRYATIDRWAKEHMRTVGAKYKKEFVDEFKEACTILETSPSQVFREAMQATIDKAKG